MITFNYNIVYKSDCNHYQIELNGKNNTVLSCILIVNICSVLNVRMVSIQSHLINFLFFRSVSSLKNQMEKERKNHKQEYFRKLRENAFLLEEIAELKKELTEAKKYR